MREKWNKVRRSDRREMEGERSKVGKQGLAIKEPRKVG
jgi:hypothetical protein